MIVMIHFTDKLRNVEPFLSLQPLNTLFLSYID